MTNIQVPKRCGFRNKVVIPLVLVVIAALVLWDGAVRRPAGPASGGPIDINSPALRQSTIRIAAFNIHGGVGKDGRRDLNRTFYALKDFDFIGLNEIHQESMIAQLAENLSMKYVFTASERRFWHEGFGNGFLTWLPVQSWVRMPLASSSGRLFKNVTLIRLQQNDKIINILLTHLDHRDDRLVQLRAVGEMFCALAEPAILMGDLNTPPADPAMQDLLTRSGGIDALAGKSTDHIDWILVKGLTVRDSGLIDKGASDHPVIWADLAPELPVSPK